MSDNKNAKICGIVMPISSIDSCSEEHWRDVKLILDEAIEDAGFQPQLVSEADDVGVIQKRIIQNLYENPVVVCDVSAKNPNVMFELGMRLAFDKPTIIIKDDKTSYSFDTSPVEHLSYPRDLRFSKIVEFKEALAEKIKATHDKAKSDPGYTTFLKHFGTFKVAELKTEVVPQDRILLEEVQNLRDIVLAMSSSIKQMGRDSPPPTSSNRILCLREVAPETVSIFINAAQSFGYVGRIANAQNGHGHVRFEAPGQAERKQLLELARKFSPEARWLGSRVD